MLQYPPISTRPYPLTAILRAHILSVRSPQLRFSVRGDKGTFIKYGLDVQEDQLKAMPGPEAIFEQGYGREPEAIHGTVENLDAAGAVIKSQ